MEKINSHFSKRIAQYGALSIAITSINKANGEIIYRNVDPDQGGVGVTALIDFDNNAQWDAYINGYNFGSIVGLFAVPRNGNAIIATSTNGPFYLYNYPFALDQGNLISTGNMNWNANYSFQTMNLGSCNFTNSHWCEVTDKYLGIRFTIGANTHFGWARLDVTNASNWLLKDYAYNSTPNAPISAGEGLLGLNDQFYSEIKVVGLKKSIGIYNLQEAADYKLFSITGQELLKGTTENKDYVIEATTMASGVYIVELSDTKSNAVIRKKVVLQ